MGGDRRRRAGGADPRDPGSPEGHDRPGPGGSDPGRPFPGVDDPLAAWYPPEVLEVIDRAGDHPRVDGPGAGRSGARSLVAGTVVAAVLVGARRVTGDLTDPAPVVVTVPAAVALPADRAVRVLFAPDDPRSTVAVVRRPA